MSKVFVARTAGHRKGAKVSNTADRVFHTSGGMSRRNKVPTKIMACCQKGNHKNCYSMACSCDCHKEL